MCTARPHQFLPKVVHLCSAVYVFNCIRQLVAQELDDNGIHVSYARRFHKPTSDENSEVIILGLDWTYFDCWCTSEACKYKKRSRYGSHDDFLLNCSICCKKHTAYCALLASRFSQTLWQEGFASKWWLWSKVKALNFETFETCQFNESRLFICKCSGKHVSWMKQGAKVMAKKFYLNKPVVKV